MDFPEKHHFERSHWELYKELERTNLNLLQVGDPKIDRGGKQKSFTKYIKFAKIKYTDKNKIHTKETQFEDQSTIFLNSMKVVIILGQCLGLNPVIGILQTKSNLMRFNYFSWKCLYSFVMCSYQVLATILCVYNVCINSITIKALAYVSFFVTTSTTTIMFISIAQKWPTIIYEIRNSKLDEYVDRRVKIRCYLAVVVMLIMSLFEQILAQIAIYANVFNSPMVEDVYKMMTMSNDYWFYDIGVPYSLPLAIFVQVLNSITTVNWNYPDMFITCICLYLMSIFDKINEKINSAHNKSCQPWFWRSVRDDYTRATRLVRLFDDVISGIIFVSFANNLFFICLQIYNVLQHSVTIQRVYVEEYSNVTKGPFNGYENCVYYMFSIFLVISRFLAVSLLASRVHSVIVRPTTALYRVPTQYYCSEIERFIEQVHSEDVALSGLQFFHITKSLILSVAGTVVTYELVLLQFNGDY